MKKTPAWKRIFRNKHTLALVIAAAVLTALEVALPYLSDVIPRGVFAVMSALSVAGAFVARLVAQKEIDG